MEKMYDVIIIGSGPAGLTAAIYTTRANLKTLIIAGKTWGGQLMLTTDVENYPGFPEGIQGPELMQNMRKQAERFGAIFVDADVEPVDFNLQNGPFTVKANNSKYTGRVILIATGADSKKLGVPGEHEFAGRGISYCATCDGAFFKEKNIIVVGGGDSAMEEALFLTRFAAQVTIVHRRDTFRASQIMQERVRTNPKIELLLNSQIVEVLGENKVKKVTIQSPVSVIPNSFRDLPENQEMLKQVQHDSEKVKWQMPIDGAFVAIGHSPNTSIFKGVELRDGGYVRAEEGTKTNIPGVFVSGDVEDDRYRQAVTAAGFGCMAALDIERYLRDKMLSMPGVEMK